MVERVEYSPEIIEKFARAWASIDGKAELFDSEKANPPDHQGEDTGTYDGYIVEAEELLKRAGCDVYLRT